MAILILTQSAASIKGSSRKLVGPNESKATTNFVSQFVVLFNSLGTRFNLLRKALSLGKLKITGELALAKASLNRYSKAIHRSDGNRESFVVCSMDLEVLGKPFVKAAHYRICRL